MENLLDVTNLSVTIEDKNILQDCSFSVAPGEFIGIIGPNGAGKSTLLKACRGLMEKTGAVAFNGTNSTQLQEKDIARIIAYMQQDFHISFGYTCEEIVLSARYPYLSWWESESAHDKEVAARCMAFTGVSHLANLDIQSVSGGERQRVLLAKVLAQEAPLLFLDEPTASLDLLYQEEIFRICSALVRSGKSVIMICHDLVMAARWSSRLLLIADHHIAADGKPQDVLTAHHLKESFGLHSVVYTDFTSGYLNLYTYEEKNKKKKSVTLFGSGKRAPELIRLLVTRGYNVNTATLPPNSIAESCARAFGVPYNTTSEYKCTSDILIAYDMTEEEREELLACRGNQVLYTDDDSLGFTPYEAIQKRILSETL